jgi:hypothetical protein
MFQNTGPTLMKWAVPVADDVVHSYRAPTCTTLYKAFILISLEDMAICVIGSNLQFFQLKLILLTGVLCGGSFILKYKI